MQLPCCVPGIFPRCPAFLEMFNLCILLGCRVFIIIIVYFLGVFFYFDISHATRLAVK